MCVKALVNSLAEALRVVRRLRDQVAAGTPAVQVISTALEATDARSQVHVADHDAPRLEDRRAVFVGDAGSASVDGDRDELQLADHRPNSFLTPPVAVARPLERDGASSSQRGLAQASEGLHPLQGLLADARDASLGLRASSMKVRRCHEVHGVHGKLPCRCDPGLPRVVCKARWIVAGLERSSSAVKR